MAEYQAQLVAVEAKLAKDPENEELISLKNDLIELIELSSTIEDETDQQQQQAPSQSTSTTNKNSARYSTDSSRTQPSNQNNQYDTDKSATSSGQSPTSAGGKVGQKRQISEADLLAKKKEKNKKKKAKLREKIKEQLDIAEGEKQSWQSFANRKGLKGLTKKSIFASPYSTTGKVGVGTNGIADTPSTITTATTTRAATNIGAKRKY